LLENEPEIKIFKAEIIAEKENFDKIFLQFEASTLLENHEISLHPKYRKGIKYVHQRSSN
jgi:hypothetical protein